VWIVSTLLDRADSELARLKDCATLRGHFYDYQSDLMVKSGIFLCLGIGLRDGAIGNWSIVLGFVAAVSVAVASLLADRLELLIGRKAVPSRHGFDSDDVLFLLAPAIWSGSTLPIVAGATIGAPFVALLIWRRTVQVLANRTTAPS
jgi:hypothetical protein